MITNTEYEIIKGCKDNNKHSQKKLYELYKSKMFAICKRYLKEDYLSEEAFQEGFIKVFFNIKNFKYESKIETWLTRIFINESINILRSSKKNRSHLDIDDIEYKLINHSEIHFDEKIILSLLEKMDNIYGDVLMMYVLDGLSHKEISKILNISEKNSCSILSRARVKFIKLHNSFLKKDLIYSKLN
jgi:RNA polymerase sigma-70 factor (ECF subfamily)